MFLWILSAWVKNKFPDVDNITTDELSEKVKHNNNLLVVDNRQQQEYNVSFINGAKLLEFPLTENVLTEFVEKNVSDETEEIICYCSVGYRSSVVAGQLGAILAEKKKDDVKVYNLEGSMFKWVNEDRPVTNVKSETVCYAHPYSYMWGMLGLNIWKWRWS